MDIKHLEASLNDVMRFWVEQYQFPPNTHIHRYEWFWNPMTGKVAFTVFVADGPNPLK